MKKYATIVLILASIGAALCVILLLEHYFPDSQISSIFCGKDFANPCAEVSRSSYASIFGIPLAAWGLALYLTIAIIVLVFDYAGGFYLEYLPALLIPVLVCVLILDAILASLLIAMGQPCQLCIATYIVSLGLMITCIIWRRQLPHEKSISQKIHRILYENADLPEKKGLIASIFLLIFLTVSTSLLIDRSLRHKSNIQTISSQEVKAYIQSFEQAPAESIKFPVSTLVLGDRSASLTIYAFTDFLCSACYEFYKIEKRLLSKFKGKIKIVYYNYPLDQSCNKDMNSTIYKGSCSSSRAMLAAAKLPILDSYLTHHFKNYKKIKKNYKEATSLSIFDSVSKDAHNLSIFKESMKSSEIDKILKRDINFAISLKIDSTPTFFISGKRLVGVPPQQYLDALIEHELKKAR